jgi:signal transduction histidine kinase
MLYRNSAENRKMASRVPRRLMIAVICVLCLALLGNGLYTFVILSRLRTEYLQNIGHEIAAALEAQARGAGRRNNPAVWQSLFEKNYETYSRTVAFLALMDREGNFLAAYPESSARPDPTISRSGVYRFEEQLGRPRHGAGGAVYAVEGWRIQAGLYTRNADFILRLALLQLALSGVASIALIVLLIYLVRMLNRFLKVKEREAAEAHLKSLGIMAASLAHEIRNPLGAIKGLTQLTQEEVPADHSSQERMRTIVGEAERLERLVENLLDFARPKEPRIEEFDLNALLSDLKTILQPRMEAAGVGLQVVSEPGISPVRSDPGGLRQVLLNVVINALDASNPGGVVVLRAVREGGPGLLIFQIDDSGTGLGEVDPSELLQPFVTTKARGTGLGLAVSRQIVENLGGSLSLARRSQGGVRCSIQLPMTAGNAK